MSFSFFDEVDVFFFCILELESPLSAVDSHFRTFLAFFFFVNGGERAEAYVR